MSEVAFDELLRRLVDAGVRFVLVGGLAVNAWGVVRGTRDLDLVPDPDPENLAALARLAVELGGHVQGPDMLAGSERSISALLAAGERVLVETRLGPIDVVHGLPGVPPFADLEGRAVDVEAFGVGLRVCSLDDLFEMKRAAGRTRDQADLEDLGQAHPDRD